MWPGNLRDQLRIEELCWNLGMNERGQEEGPLVRFLPGK